MKTAIAANFMKMATLGDLFDWRVGETPENEAYRHFNSESGRWHSHTWAQIGERVRIWRSALTASRLPSEARVAVLLPNGLDAVCIDQASLALGLIPVPMHALDNPASIAYIIKDCDASMLVLSTRAQWEAIAAVGETMPFLKLVLVVDDGNFDNHYASAPVHGVVVALATWLAGGALPNNIRRPPVSGGALAAIVYTSGTTGKPKGVMLTHNNVLSNIQAVMARVEVRSSDVFLSFLPLSHTFERTVGYYLPVAAGSCVAYARSVAQIPEDLATIRPTVLVSVPRIYERAHVKLQGKLAESGYLTRRLFALTQAIGWRRFCRSQQLPCNGASPGWLDQLLYPALRLLVARKVLAQFGGRLRVAVCGGAPLSQAVAECFLALGLPLVQGYGMTETSPVISCNTPSDNWPATVGKPLEGVRVRIGENSELQVRGGGVMAGYWKRPDDTANAMTDDGWLRTGDQAAMEGGRIRIIGRIKEIIVTSTGEKIAPADLELAITADPLFEQAFVIGDNRPFIAAFVVPGRSGLDTLLQQLELGAGESVNLDSASIQTAVLQRIQAASKHFPSYAVPRVVRVTMEPWSLLNGLMTPTLKLKRNALLAHFHTEIDDIYAQRTPAQIIDEAVQAVVN
ncbi:long-chain acyl-CoA synthetase [Collimonas sp. OK307]|uniref:AMP-dependent synthetase/ligase n=1 Tax=Collimonas sp. OK307 TaxID=1801620 RepID=UPI0008E45C2B|nr:AMP-binding protein [Collimonas sp. OK307]SFI36087.1 long-chain acyl-CoA synthetase [Collimonas sp. OK307]